MWKEPLLPPLPWGEGLGAVLGVGELPPMDLYALGFWYSLGYARISGGFVILLVLVAWET